VEFNSTRFAREKERARERERERERENISFAASPLTRRARNVGQDIAWIFKRRCDGKTRGFCVATNVTRIKARLVRFFDSQSRNSDPRRVFILSNGLYAENSPSFSLNVVYGKSEIASRVFDVHEYGSITRVLDVRNILLFADLIHILYEDNLNSLTVYASVCWNGF